MIPANALRDMLSQYYALTVGFSEDVHFTTDYNGTEERRTVMRDYKSLIAQLEQYAVQPLQQGPRGPSGPNKAGSRPPTNTQYADCIESIQETALKEVQRLTGDRCANLLKAPAVRLLTHLVDEVRDRCWEQPGDCVRAIEAIAAMYHKARVMLGYEARTIALADTSCHQCGGALKVAQDASTDVICTECGHAYERLRWIDLL